MLISPHPQVRVLRADASTIEDMNLNLKSAVNAVLPLLPSCFSDRELFLVVLSCSFDS